MAFQYPVEIPGVSNAQFLVWPITKSKNTWVLKSLDPLGIQDLLKEKAKIGEMEAELMFALSQRRFFRWRRRSATRSANGGTRSQAFGADETRPGLDIDALRIVAEGVNNS